MQLMGLDQESQWFQLFERGGVVDGLNILSDRIEKKRTSNNIFPPQDQILRAFQLCDFRKVKVVILGQDPYHGFGQAHGLAFSVNKGIKLPPSLVNIFKEIQRELGGEIPRNGDLTAWAEQGVLLLNTILTVEESKPLSHQDLGWQTFTNKCIQWLNKHSEGLAFMLWGSHAQKFAAQIDRQKHQLFQTSHPSPLSVYRGFDDCGHFKEVNNYLTSLEKEPINWIL
ncbi:MAG: uracil-DNA glycosylase [Bacteroidia bacterium]|nr:uracil-DNA glycosylase [Bacteroidia bacterium]